MILQPEQVQDIDELFDLMLITKQTPMNLINEYKTQLSQIMYHIATLQGPHKSEELLRNMYININSREKEFMNINQAFKDKVALMRDLAMLETAK